MAKEASKTIVYSALEVANLCGVVNQTVINWIKKGYLSAFSTPGNQYRIYQDDLISFMKSKNMRIPTQILNTENKSKREINMSVLVIEDEKGLNLVVAKYIEREYSDKTVTSVFDGFEAGIKLSEKNTDVVILDIDIKGLDSIDLCRKIVQDDNFGKPNLIVIMGKQNSDVETELKNLGIENIFKKPLNFDELKPCFDSLLK